MARTRSYYRNQMATVAWLHGAGNRYGGRDAGGDVSEQNQIISYELGPGGLASAQAGVKKKRRGGDGPSNVAAETCPRGGGGEDGCCLDLVVAERVVCRPVVIEIDSDTESDSDKGLESDHDSDLNPKARSASASCLERRAGSCTDGFRDPACLSAVTTSVVVNKVMGTFVLPIVQLDDHPGIFLIRLPNPTDVDKFHGHAWNWCGENVFFTRVLRVLHTDARDVFINMEVHQVY
ncbi:hypothetical protein HU200_062724 [Digitaria exilis]|uniref:Uncharacterized protein n=1 Tax=Digitaria exilis TaxID=1010633 RepID=A0A835ACF7_9POAL|nr:hypothetical protein HU200_062724 [Digitaria exilis]